MAYVTCVILVTPLSLEGFMLVVIFSLVVDFLFIMTARTFTPLSGLIALLSSLSCQYIYVLSHLIK